ncbi:MAG: hypothetical protein HZB75_04305 [Candidatus Saccharibacteria bacterium]|nr:MAG: hypothetical protein HZB75_04305 [Candidatus Saccharibacteria bacterium]
MKMKKVPIILTKPRIIVAAIVGLLIAVGGYTYWSAQVWNNYETSYAAWKQDLDHDIDAALQLPTTTSDERSKKVAELKAVVMTIKENQSACDISGAVAWQQNVGGLGAKIKACEEMMRPVVGYSSKLDSTLAYLEAERRLADIISSTATNTKQTEKTWDAQVASWSKAINDINSLQVSDNFVATKEYAIKYAKKMESTWKSLVIAHKAKNKANYLKAYAEITRAHEMLTVLASDSQARLKVILSDLQASYDTLK